MEKYMTLDDLSARWSCHRSTARQRTCEPDFPPVLALSRKQLLWDAQEVEAWEQHRKQHRTRPVRVRYNGQALPLPAKVAREPSTDSYSVAVNIRMADGSSRDVATVTGVDQGKLGWALRTLDGLDDRKRAWLAEQVAERA